MALRTETPSQAEFLTELFGAGYFIPSGVPGVYGRSAEFELVRCGFDRLIDRASAAEGAERVAFPPLLPRHQLEETRYLESFPHLAGSIFAFVGDEEEAAEQAERAARHEDWAGFQRMSNLVLTPAACYPIYPMVAARGQVPPGGVVVDGGGSYVFRHEPSGDPARLQMFHQREIVCIGAPATVEAWRDRWRDRALELLTTLGLDAETDIANDPFFGRGGRLLARGQRRQRLKFEVLVQIASDSPTAVASFNYHQDHFSSTYGIELEGNGGLAHTACLGFGEERIVLALLRRHGLDLGYWPRQTRVDLGIP